MTKNKQAILRAIIVDDEELARQGMELRLQHFPQVEVLRSCASAREAIAAIIELESIAYEAKFEYTNGFDFFNFNPAENK